MNKQQLIEKYITSEEESNQKFLEDCQFVDYPEEEDRKILTCMLSKIDYFLKSMDCVVTYPDSYHWIYFIKNERILYQNNLLNYMWEEFKFKLDFNNTEKFIDLLLNYELINGIGSEFYENLNDSNADIFLEDIFSYEKYNEIINNDNLFCKFLTLLYFIKFPLDYTKFDFLKIFERIESKFIKNLIINNSEKTEKHDNIFSIVLGYNILWDKVHNSIISEIKNV